MGKKKKNKQELYEYQYTTPNKKVVKEFLPAVSKPAGIGDNKSKVTWGAMLGIFGGWKLLGVLDMLSWASPFGIIKDVILYGAIAGVGIYQLLKGKTFLGRAELYDRYM